MGVQNRLLFGTSNNHKLVEARSILEPYGFVIQHFPVDLIELQNNKLKVLPAVDLQTLTAVISKSKFTITPDTAIVHIACGVNVPVAAFYTREEQFYNEWQPIGVKSVSIFAKGNSHVSEIVPSEALEKIMQLYDEISVNE